MPYFNFYFFTTSYISKQMINLTKLSPFKLHHQLIYIFNCLSSELLLTSISRCFYFDIWQQMHVYL